MRRLLLFFFIFLVVGVGLALVFREHNGYVQIAYADWRLETSLFFFLAALVAGLYTALLLWRLAVTGALLPRNLRELLARRGERKARRSLYQGLLKLFEGRWADAENELAKLAERQDNPTLNYLGAARCAQHLQAPDRRDRYLEQAAARRGSSELAILLTQAELQIEQGQDAEALATLTRLREIEPTHGHGLVLLTRLSEQMGDWAQVRELLPLLRKQQLLGEDKRCELSIRAWTDLIRQAEANADTLPETWKRVPRDLRRNPAVQLVYVRKLIEAGAPVAAADLIRATLRTQWDAGLALAFGDIASDNRTAQLATVEAWLKQYGEEPELLLVAGRLCLRNRLWGRARSYLENSLRGVNRPSALLELGRLFEEIDQDEEARQAFRQGLEAVLDNPR